MFLFLKYKKFFLLLILITSCAGPSSKITELHEEIFNEQRDITCPDVKFIEGLDKLSVGNENNIFYDLKFYEVKWKCYFSFSSEPANQVDNIDLYVSFKVDYKDDISNFKTEKFSFIVVLLNNNDEIITKEKFNRSFLSSKKSEIILNNEALISIQVNNSEDNIYKYKLLLGFVKN